MLFQMQKKLLIIIARINYRMYAQLNLEILGVAKSGMVIGLRNHNYGMSSLDANLIFLKKVMMLIMMANFGCQLKIFVQNLMMLELQNYTRNISILL